MRRLRLLIGLLVSITLVWLFFLGADPGMVASSLQGANYATLVPAVLVYFAGVWLRSARWGLLLKPVASLPTRRLFRAMLIGFTVNDLMPVRLGEIARAILLARWAAIPPGATLGTIVVERLFDGLTLCAILAVAWFWVPLTGWLHGAVLVGGVVFLVGTLLAALGAFWPRSLLVIGVWIAAQLPRSLGERALQLGVAFLDGLAVIRHGRILVLTTLLSVAAWLSEAAMYYIIMLGFGFDAGPISALIGMAAANLGTMVPSAPGFVGTFDVPLKTVLVELFGVPAGLAEGYTVIVHAALIVPVVAVGLVLLWREGLSLGEVSRRAAGRRPLSSRSTDPAPRAL